jgi:hypothetical protein
MKLVQPERSYFDEVGEIVSVVEELKSLGLQVYFDRNGIRVSDTNSKAAKDPFYQTASELRAFLYGLEDGFFHCLRVDQALFTDSKFTNPKIKAERQNER